jgi:hypothetical protein
MDFAQYDELRAVILRARSALDEPRDTGQGNGLAAEQAQVETALRRHIRGRALDIVSKRLALAVRTRSFQGTLR